MQFSKIKRVIGYLLVIVSIIMGGTSVGMFVGEDVLLVLIMFVLVSCLPLIIGLFLLEGKEIFTVQFAKGPLIRTYLFLTVFTPLTLLSADYFSQKKMQRLSSENDVYLVPLAYEWIGYVLVFAAIILFLCFMRIFIGGWKDTEKHVKQIFFITLLIIIVLNVINNNGFKAIRTNGIAIEKLGDKEEISWKEVQNVDMNGYIGSDGFSKTSGSSFKWEFKFHLKEGKDIVFGPFSYTNDHLKVSLKIKEVLKDQKISLTTDMLTAKEWDFVQVDMDYEKANPKDFYTIFQFNPKTKEYYYLPYE